MFLRACTSTDFYGSCDLNVKQEPVEMLTVTEHLKRMGNLDEVGGAGFIAELTDKVVSTAHLEFYARIIAQKHLARELVSLTFTIHDKGFDGQSTWMT